MALSCGMITMIDDAIGDIMAALTRSGKADDTIVVFNSDHGDYLGDYNLLLKGAIMLRSINNVSFIWADPQARSGAVSHALTSTVDIAPSVIERAGLKPYFGIQGKSLLRNLDGSSDLRNQLVVEHQDNMTRMGFKEPCMVRTLLLDGYRLTIYKGENWGELYDHAKDPHESHNRWDDAAYSGQRARLTELLAQEMMENVDQSPRARRRA
jgi:arylsulfatase A-like enzyme